MKKILGVIALGALMAVSASAKDRVMFLSAHPDDIISSLGAKLPSWGR